MRNVEKWIWLDSKVYPEYQKTNYSAFHKDPLYRYTVAEFQKKYAFQKKIALVQIRFSADTAVQLFCNGQIIATGPVLVGGDFLGNDMPRQQHYATKFSITPDTDCLDFFARVKMTPIAYCEFSKGHGGFMLTAHITFEDGTKTFVTTDKTWMARRNGAYVSEELFDAAVQPDEYLPAEEINNIWHCITAPLPLCVESKVLPEEGGSVTAAAHEKKELLLHFDKIYAGYISLSAKTEGILKLSVACCELPDESSPSMEHFVLSSESSYRGFRLHSVGAYKLLIENESDKPAELSIALIETHQPVPVDAVTQTSDDTLNEILRVCKHTLKYCRQYIHLDSPRHCEPLACTGDYYIESLMTAFSFGDMSLAEFDVIRTAQLLLYNNGRMFHTTYSLIWVQMLYDTYLFTGNKQLLKECQDALTLLLSVFRTYMGQNGILETPPDYMFIDWIYIDGISLHHPPKALGQSCLNMYYYGALCTAAKIYDILGEGAMAEECRKHSESLKSSVNALLYNPEKGLYFEGLNTPTPEHLLGGYMPQNTDKRYYRINANVLAACYGLCGKADAQRILRKLLADSDFEDYQPYFAHFVLEAIYKNDLREEFTLKVIDRWRKPVLECGKGLAEGFLPPEPTYQFDHSHAWGGTPVYSLPKALLGFEIAEPGLKKIRLNPSLLGLDFASVEVPTPYGMVTCVLEKGKEPKISAPDEVEVTVS